MRAKCMRWDRHACAQPLGKSTVGSEQRFVTHHNLTATAAILNNVSDCVSECVCVCVCAYVFVCVCVCGRTF